MMNSSNLTNLNVDAGTEVILGDAANPHSGNRVDLTIANLSGNGTFYVRSDIARDGNTAINNGDKIYITDSSSGAHKVYVRDANLGNIATSTLGTERLRIVEDSSGGTATFALGGDAGTGYPADKRRCWSLFIYTRQGRKFCPFQYPVLDTGGHAGQ